MKVLIAHRERTAHMKSAMDEMISLHDDLYGTWEQIVYLTREEGLPEAEERERIGKIEALHHRTEDLARKIIDLRRETFGSISDEASLDLASLVDSTGLLYPQGEPESS